MTTVFEVLHKKAEPYKVTLTRGQKGGYGWEITITGSSFVSVVEALGNADRMMKEKFGGGDVP